MVLDVLFAIAVKVGVDPDKMSELRDQAGALRRAVERSV